jgi:SAM-dependent methyltransferase
MIDFIEHTPAPRAAIARARRILAPGGVLCLVTPDIHSFAARLAGRRWWHLRPGHLAYFSRRSLRALLASGGFSIVRERRYAWTFSAHYLLSRIPLLRFLAASRRASFLKRIPIKLSLGDSFEIYAVRDAIV